MHLRRYTDAADEAQRTAVEITARPMVDEAVQLLDLAMAAMSSAELDRAAGRWADAQANETIARGYARRWRELNKGV